MNGSITTVNELRARQEEDHPEWVPAVADLFYACHGTGSDRDRVFSIDELRELLQVAITSLSGIKNLAITYTSSSDRIQIVGTNGIISIEGGNPPKIKFTSASGGPSSELTYSGLKLIINEGESDQKDGKMSLDSDGNFTSDKSYVLESSQATHRQFKVKSSGDGSAYAYMDYNKVVVLDGNGNTVVDDQGVTITKRTGSGSASVSMLMSDTNDSVTFDKPVKLAEYLVGSLWKIARSTSGSGTALSFEILENGTWTPKAVFRDGGNELKVNAQLSYDTSNWIYEAQDVDFSGQGHGASYNLSDFKENAPFAIFNTNAYATTQITVIDNTGNRTYEIAAGCARWFVKTRVNGTVTLFAFGGNAW